MRKDLLKQIDPLVEEKEAELAHQHCFYRPTLDKDGILKDIIIDRVNLLELLKENGFYRYDLGMDSYCFILVDAKKVKQVSTTFITDWWFRYIDSLEPYTWELPSKSEDGGEIKVTVRSNAIKNKFLKALNSYFSDAILYRLTPADTIEFNTDTKTEKYIYYKNGFVLIQQNHWKFFDDYAKLDNHIWENQILNRDFNPDRMYDYRTGDFCRFCFNVSGQNQSRFEALQTIIGYTLHHFREYKLKATILTDAQMSMDGEANGRTGKGIFVNGLGYMLNNKDNEDAKVYCQINGKGFDFTEKHRYQKADINTKLIHLEDVKAYFIIDNLFNDITEGVEVDKKNEKPFTVYPKFILSTNKTIKINGGSAKDRVIQFEFAEHYSKDYSPEKEFGRWLFTEWNKTEWERFDAFMVQCVCAFFNNDLQVKEIEAINLNQRALIDHTSQEFVNYIDFYKFTDDDHKQGTKRGSYLVPAGLMEKEYSKKDLYNDFIESYPHFQKRKGFSQSKFTNWLRSYAENSDHLEPIDPKNDERRSNNIDYIIFRRKRS